MLALPFGAKANLAGFAYQDEYAALLSRMAEKGIKSPNDGDFLGPVKYWQELWDRVSGTDNWQEMMKNAVLITKSTKEYNGPTGKTYTLLTRANGVAWLAFPGVSTDANMASGAKGGFITWPGNGNTNAAKDVHQYFYAEWKSLEGSVTQWLTSNKANFSKLIVTGHSKGAVLSQYFLADYGDDLSTIAIHFTAFGAPNGTSAQNWVYDVDNRMIRSGINFNKCLDLVNGSTANGTNIQLYDCVFSNNQPNQQWVVDDIIWAMPIGTNIQIHLAIDPGKCVDIKAAGTADGTNIQLYHCHTANSSQYFTFDGRQIKMQAPPDKCLDLSQSKTDNGTNIQLWGCNGTNAQKWIYDSFLKAFRSSINPNKCLDLDHSNTADKTNIQLWDCNGTDAQQFFILE